MRLTRTTGALVSATALTLAGLAMPATASAQTGITVGEPGSAQYQAPTASMEDPQQLCGTVYVGEYDSALRPAPLPDEAKAIAGLPVQVVDPDGNVAHTVTTNAHGGYCIDDTLVFDSNEDGTLDRHLSVDQAAIAAYNAQPGVDTLTLTKVSWDQDFIAEVAEDSMAMFSYLDTVTYKLHNANIAFSETPAPPEPMGSTESASLQFLNLPEILRGMLHGGAMGS